MMLEHILWFRASFGDSRLYEFQSVAESRLSTPIQWCWDHNIQLLDGGDIGPNLIQPLPSLTPAQLQTLANVAHHTMACKGVFTILGEGRSKEECINALHSTARETLSKLICDSWCFRFAQIGKGNRFSPSTRRDIVEAFGAIIPTLHRFPVDIENPKHELYYIEDYRRPMGSPAIKKNCTPHYVWLLYRHMPKTNRPHIRSWEEKLAVHKRAFISATSLDASRSLQLANIALGGNGEGKRILDPFCGSGSILLAAAALGATCVGSDKLHYLLLRHKRVLQIPASKGRENRGIEKVSLFDNFQEQNLPEPTIISSLDIFSEDFISIVQKANQHTSYDAIITDPPYGLRASKAQHTDQLFERLFCIAEQLLIDRGHLVFLFPEAGDVHTIPSRKPKDILYFYAKKYNLTICSFGWERFQRHQIRLVAVLRKNVQHVV